MRNTKTAKILPPTPDSRELLEAAAKMAAAREAANAPHWTELAQAVRAGGLYLDGHVSVYDLRQAAMSAHQLASEIEFEAEVDAAAQVRADWDPNRAEVARRATGRAADAWAAFKAILSACGGEWPDPNV